MSEQFEIHVANREETQPPGTTPSHESLEEGGEKVKATVDEMIGQEPSKKPKTANKQQKEEKQRNSPKGAGLRASLFSPIDSDAPMTEKSEGVGRRKGTSMDRTYQMGIPPSVRERFWVRMAKAASDIRHSSMGDGAEEEKEKGLYPDQGDYAETNHTENKSSHDFNEGEIIPTLLECHQSLTSEVLERYRTISRHPCRGVKKTFLDLVSAFYVYVANTMLFETCAVLLNAILVTWYFCEYADDFATKLDFSFLAFSVVFPLTFLIQQAFGRREQALSKLADFRSSILSTALMTLTVDWPRNGNDDEPRSFTGGRSSLPSNFETNVLEDCRELIRVVYQYLSTPSPTLARNVVFQSRDYATRTIHASQNDCIRRFNDLMVDFTLHGETMREYGFPSGEASRLHQYHQYLQQRFEQLRYLKYYRTPQATLAFGRAYMFILPWLSGPYYAWVWVGTNHAFTLVLAAATYLILLGLMNTQRGLEDPFVPDYGSWTPGLDTVKLDYEMAVALQAIEQYRVQVNLRRAWELDEGLRRKERTVAQEATVEKSDVEGH